jgi:hypothetical protein
VKSVRANGSESKTGKEEKMNKVTTIIALVGVVFLSACSSMTPGSPESLAKLQKEKMKAKEKALENTIDEMPKWYLKTPTSDYAVYAAGTGVSDDPQYSLDIAILRAKVMLADRLQGELSQKSKSIKTNGSEINTQATQNVINGVNVAGYKIKHKVLELESGKVRAYVLLEYPINGTNDVLEYKATQEDKKFKNNLTEKALSDLEKL